MALQGEVIDEIKQNDEKSKKIMQKDSIQYNKQELDQEQKVDVNPLQLTSQNIHIHINDDLNKYCGTISGKINIENNEKIPPNTKVSLFLGNENQASLLKLRPDSNGEFVIKDIPPGFYTLLIESRVNSQHRSKCIKIKILPGQTFNKSIHLDGN